MEAKRGTATGVDGAKVNSAEGLAPTCADAKFRTSGAATRDRLPVTRLQLGAPQKFNCAGLL